MKKILTILFITLIALNSEAQIAKIFANDFTDSNTLRFGIISDYDLNSNAITNTFSKKFYTGGYINNDLKNTVLNRVKNNNRIGGNINNGIYAAFKLNSFDYKNVSVFFSIRDRAHFDAAFSKDLYKIGFYGNSQYVGKTANIGNFDLNLIRYQQIQVGIFSTDLDSAARWGIGVSFIKGEQYLNVTAKKAELFTSMDGQFINLNTELSAAKSDTSKKGIAAFNGSGASVDLFFEAPLQTRLGPSKITASVSDVGAIRFNEQTLSMSQDTIFNYSGFKINNIFDLRDSTIGSRAKDSIVNSIAPFKKHAYSVTLPAILNFSFETKFTKWFRLTEGIRYVFNANYKLQYYLTGNFHVNSKLILSPTFAYGGYGIFNYGFNVSAKLGKSFVIYAGSNNVEGFIIPKKTTGQGAYICLIKKFK